MTRFDNTTFEGESVDSISADDYGNKIFFAKWQTITYQVVFNENGGEYSASYTKPLSYEEGKGLLLPTENNISKSGHVFAGWYTNTSFTGSPVLEISVNETGNREYFAKWNRILSITFIAGENGSVTTGSITIGENESIRMDW